MLDVNDWFKTKSACSTLMCFLSHHGTIPHLITTQRVRRCDPTGGDHSKNTSASNTAYLSVTSLITWSDRCGGDTALRSHSATGTSALCAAKCFADSTTCNGDVLQLLLGGTTWEEAAVAASSAENGCRRRYLCCGNGALIVS